MTKQTILIVSYEAGAAEILSAWAKIYPEKDNLRFCLQGPALNIFSRKLPFFSENLDLSFISHLNPRTDFVLTGSSWTPELERKAIAEAKRGGIKCVTFLDHWVNYRERFGTPDNWKEKLPDEIWVGDEYAYQIALSIGFPVERLIKKENLYFIELKEQLSRLSTLRDSSTKENKLRLLYVCEPVSDDVERRYGRKDYWGYTEFSLMEQFMAELVYLEGIFSEVCIRLHPNEKDDTYDQQLKKYNGSIRVFKSRNATILPDCVWSDIVVGVESMGLVVSLLANKKVFSCIPPGGKMCSLPHKEIIHIEGFKQIINYL